MFWNFHPEAGSPLIVVPADVAAVGLGHLPGHGQAQADTFRFAGYERFKQALAHFRRRTRSRIPHFKYQMFFPRFMAESDFNPTLQAGGLDGIADHV
jgi:hypothetical protein